MSKKQFSDSGTKKGYYGYSSESRNVSTGKNKKEGKNNSSKNRRSSILSGILAVIQLIASVSFVGLILYKKIDVSVPVLFGIIAVLIILLAVVFALAQRNSLGAKRTGKVISVIVIIILGVLIYFISPLSQMTGEKVSEEPFIAFVSADDNFGAIPKNSNSHSDTNILAVVNPKTHTVLMVSTPRDYYVEIAAESVAPNSFDKLTHVGLYGNGIAYDSNGNNLTASEWDWAQNTNWHVGYETIMNTLKKLYGFEISDSNYHYVKINFTGFADLIDTLGGVTIDVEQGFSTTTYASYGDEDTGERKTYVYSEGEMKMDGATALTFARERKSFGSGDMQRNKNQVKVVKAIASEVLTAKSLLKYNSIIDSVENCFTTDINLSSLASLQIQIMGDKDYNGWNIYSYSTTGTPGREKLTWNGLYKSVVLQDEASISNATELINMVLSGSPATEVEAKVNEYSE